MRDVIKRGRERNGKRANLFIYELERFRRSRGQPRAGFPSQPISNAEGVT